MRGKSRTLTPRSHHHHPRNIQEGSRRTHSVLVMGLAIANSTINELRGGSRESATDRSPKDASHMC
jgi:hypothetical protein